MNLMSRVNLWLPVFLFTGSGFSLGAAFVSFTKGNTGSTVFSLVMAVVDMAIGAVGVSICWINYCWITRSFPLFEAH